MSQGKMPTAEELNEVAARLACSFEQFGAAMEAIGKGFKQAAEAVRQLPADQLRKLLGQGSQCGSGS